MTACASPETLLIAVVIVVLLVVAALTFWDEYRELQR